MQAVYVALASFPLACDDWTRLRTLLPRVGPQHTGIPTARREHMMRIVLVGCIVVLGVLAGVLAHAVEPLLLYDDFNAEQLDAGKWVREEDGAGIKSTVQLQDNRMRLLHRSYGKTDSDKGQDSGGL